MIGIERLLLPLLLWRQVILLFALLLGLEGLALLLAAVRYRRPRRERLVVVVPVAAFCALLVVARALLDTYTYWQAYTVWEIEHYPGSVLVTLLDQTTQDAAPSAQGATPLGIELAVLTAVLLAGGWALVIRWQAPPPPRAKHGEATVAAAPAGAPDESLEIAVGPITGPLGDEAGEEAEAGGEGAGEAVGG